MKGRITGMNMSKIHCMCVFNCQNHTVYMYEIATSENLKIEKSFSPVPQLDVFFIFFNNRLSPVCAAYVLTGVGPSTGTWLTYQSPCL